MVNIEQNFVTYEQALEKFCPINLKHCKAKECMLFIIADVTTMKVIDKNKPHNPPSTNIVNLYYCGLTNFIPMMTKLGEIENDK